MSAKKEVGDFYQRWSRRKNFDFFHGRNRWKGFGGHYKPGLPFNLPTKVQAAHGCKRDAVSNSLRDDKRF